MIIEYIRKNGKHVGCVVGLNEDGQIGVGVSLCNSKDKFDKKFGKDVAIQRAKNSIYDEAKAFPNFLSNLSLELQRDTPTSIPEFLSTTAATPTAETQKVLLLTR